MKYYAEPLYQQNSTQRGDKNTCKHCHEALVYERPGDWYHSRYMKLECPKGPLPGPVISEVDPDLERLLREEEEMERHNRAAVAHAENERLQKALIVEEEITHVVADLLRIEKDLDG